MAKRRQLLDDIEESANTAPHKPKRHKHHIGTEYIAGNKSLGPCKPDGKIAHSHPKPNRELVRHLKPHLQNRVLFPSELRRN